MTASQNRDIHGVWTALATPFADDGAIDWEAFDQLIEQQGEAHVQGIVISGTTGEAPTLTTSEKIALIKRARDILEPGVRIMAGSGGNCTKTSVELSIACVDAGADSLLVVTPPYNKPTLAGLKAHYAAIVHAVNVPICLYHVPGRTAQFLSVDALRTLCEIRGVMAVKEASADVAFFSRAVIQTKVAVLSGDDPTYLASLAVGGKGVISVVSNIFPREFVAMTDAFHTGQHGLALALHNALLPAIDALFCESNPGPLKAFLSVMGIAKNTLRAPLAAVVDSNFRMIEDTVAMTKTRLAGIKY